MYVTRHLLRASLEETTAVKCEPKEEPMSPRKRRPLLQTERARDTNAKSNGSNKSKPKSGDCVSISKKAGGKGEPLRGLGLLLDAQDTQNRWCEAKVMRLNTAEKKVFIHYVGWNSRYDCWLQGECLAAHGSHSDAKPSPGKSWNGKDSLFAPSNGAKESKKQSVIKVEPAAPKKSKKRPAEDEPAKVATKVPKVSPAVKKTSTKRPVPVAKIKVGVDAVDEESERKSRRGGKDKIDLELEMEVRAETTKTAAKEPKIKSPAKRSRSTPASKAAPPPQIVTTAKSPSAAATRKPSPRRPVDMTEKEGKSESDEPMVTPSYSPTVGMFELRKSARASLVARNAGKKKRKSAEDDDSDEDYHEEEEEEEEEEDDDDEEDEVDESDDELQVRRSSSSGGKTRRPSSSSSSAPRRSSSGLITQWQTDPAYSATRERLSNIFRQRLLQRGDISAAFQGSFQQAMSGSSAASTPRTQVDEDDEEDGTGAEESKEPKKKKPKKTPTMSEEEKAAAARYYYAQHYYQLQAYQYHQYLYHQALMAQQLEHHRAAALAAEKESEVEEEGKANEDGNADDEDKAMSAKASSQPVTGSAESDEPVMNGGIIDPRFIHARMDALEEQKRIRQELYMQHYNQATERNLQILASGPEYLKHGAGVWRDQLQKSQQPKSNEVDDDSSSSAAEETKEMDDLEEKRSANMPVNLAEKDDEARLVEDTSNPSDTAVTSPHSATPEATPEVVDQRASLDHSRVSPSSPDGSSDSGSDPVHQEPKKTATLSPRPTRPKAEAVLYELVL